MYSIPVPNEWITQFIPITKHDLEPHPLAIGHEIWQALMDLS